MTETAKLTASDAAGGDEFGSSVSISGNHIVVGANRDDDGGTNSGSAYFYHNCQTVPTPDVATEPTIPCPSGIVILFFI